MDLQAGVGDGRLDKIFEVEFKTRMITMSEAHRWTGKESDYGKCRPGSSELCSLAFEVEQILRSSDRRWCEMSNVEPGWNASWMYIHKQVEISFC